MAEPRARPLHDGLRLLLYRAASQIHWPAREKALRRAMLHLGIERSARVLDVGCGYGLFAPAARGMGLGYLGLDPDAASIDLASARHGGERISFVVGAAGDVACHARPGDVAVLNGVCHHLDDAELSRALRALRDVATGVFILDHHRDAETTRLNRFLQDHDKGRYVRDSRFYERLPGYRRQHHEVFPIPSRWLGAWRYFCSYYVPEGSGDG